MKGKIPNTYSALSTLFRFDLMTQWRNRRAVVLTLLIPVIILFSWKGAVNKLGAGFILSTCISIGLTSIGLMGYSNSVARDRDKGIFQRLRIAPIPSWTIIVSRLAVQLVMILLLTVIVFVAGWKQDNISLLPQGYLLATIAAFAGGLLYLGLGQLIVGLLKNAETVNSTSRLVYFVFIMVGMFGELGMLGQEIKQLVQWSPYGVVHRILNASMQAGQWDMRATWALLLTIGYSLVFSVIGIRLFRWNTK
jgi:ABC-2 type transport system permease protein